MTTTQQPLVHGPLPKVLSKFIQVHNSGEDAYSPARDKSYTDALNWLRSQTDSEREIGICLLDQNGWSRSSTENGIENWKVHETPSNDCAPLERGSRAIKFNPVPAQEIINMAPESINWTWKSYIPDSSLVMIAGAPKAGKTTFAYHLASHITKGEDFLGKPTRKSNVLILAMEERQADVGARLRLLNASQNLYVHSGPFRSKQEELSSIEAFVKEMNIGVIIIDTLSRFWDLKDENSATETDKALESILRLARGTKAAIIAIHHTRKSQGEKGDSVRGSGDIIANTDVALILKEDGEGSRRIMTSRSRYSETPEKTTFELVDGEYVLLGAGDTSSIRINQELMVIPTEGATVEQIANLTGIKASTIRGDLRSVLGNRVERKGTGKKNDSYTYHPIASN